MHPVLLPARGGVREGQPVRRAIAVTGSERQIGAMLEPAAANRGHRKANRLSVNVDRNRRERGRP